MNHPKMSARAKKPETKVIVAIGGRPRGIPLHKPSPIDFHALLVPPPQ